MKKTHEKPAKKSTSAKKADNNDQDTDYSEDDMQSTVQDQASDDPVRPGDVTGPETGAEPQTGEKPGVESHNAPLDPLNTRII